MTVNMNLLSQKGFKGQRLQRFAAQTLMHNPCLHMMGELPISVADIHVSP